MEDIFMPKAGMDMREGRLIKWLKNVGDPVEKDEPIIEIETDKITMESESPCGGYLLAQLVEEDTVVPVLTVVGYVGQKDETLPAAPAAPLQAAPAQIASFSTHAVAPQASAGRPNGGTPATPYAKKLAQERGIPLQSVLPSGDYGAAKAADVLATPLAKRIAKINNIDLSAVKGSGYGGKILQSDLLEPACAEEGPAIEQSQPLTGIRKVVGERVLASHSQIPTVTQSVKADLSALLQLREQLNAGREQKFSINDFLLKATAMAVKELPHARTTLQEGSLVTYADANIGFAVSVENGLFVPVIKQADRLSLSQISSQARELAQKAREGGIRPDEYSGGVFSVSNMGMYGVYDFTPILNPPESGLLGVGGIHEELALRDGEIVVKKMVILCMSYDHRVMDGAGAAAIKNRVKALLENPMEILL